MNGVSLPYTLCFLLDFPSDAVLLLKRVNPPNAGLLNGVGGKLKPGETPLRCIAREVAEETGTIIPVDDFIFAGIVTWDNAQETGKSGMYLYAAHWPEKLPRHPLNQLVTDEGRLFWMPIEYLLTYQPDVVDNIPYFFTPMINGAPPQEYRCDYDPITGALQKVQAHPLPEGFSLEGVAV